MSTKLVVIHRRGLRQKYGQRFANVLAALQRLVAADSKRGLQTSIVAIDDGRAMKKVGGEVAGEVADEVAAKRAVDAAFEALQPDYLVLLDGPDVIPHQTLTQNVPDDEDHRCVPSDLPYACDAPASRDAGKFTGPTRVVGRLPGITGCSDPTALLRALDTAIKWRPKPSSDFTACLAIAASSFQGSTAMSMDAIFGGDPAREVQIVPPGGPSWPVRMLGRRLHLLDCHGVTNWPNFQGSPKSGEHYPVALRSTEIAAKLPSGVVASAQCCYSAELYPPGRAELSEPMVNSYLRRGAYGYFGSSTLSYGASDIPSLGDKLCQFFLVRLLAGASTGRAVLDARHDFLHYYDGLHDPGVLKSLAQFALFGDPSVHPVLREHDGRRPALPRQRADVHAVLAVGRRERRLRLHARGEALYASATVFDDRAHPTPAAIARRLRDEIRAAGGVAPTITSHRARPRPVAARLRKRFGGGVDAVHIATALRTPPAGVRPQRVLVVAHEAGGRLVSIQNLVSKG